MSWDIHSRLITVVVSQHHQLLFPPAGMEVTQILGVRVCLKLLVPGRRLREHAGQVVLL